MTPISPAHSLITGFCLILYPRGVTSLTSTPSRQHPEQQAAEITSGLWILPNSPAFVHVRTLGTQVEMSAHRKCLPTENWCVLPGQGDTPVNFKHLYSWRGGTRTQCSLRHQAISSSWCLQPSMSNPRVHLPPRNKVNLSWQAQWSRSIQSMIYLKSKRQGAC